MFFRLFAFLAVLAVAFANPSPNPKPEPQVVAYTGAFPYGFAGYNAPYAYAGLPYPYAGYYVR